VGGSRVPPLRSRPWHARMLRLGGHAFAWLGARARRCCCTGPGQSGKPLSTEGGPSVVGSGQGAGRAVNVAWNTRTIPVVDVVTMGDAEYLAAWEHVLRPPSALQPSPLPPPHPPPPTATPASCHHHCFLPAFPPSVAPGDNSCVTPAASSSRFFLPHVYCSPLLSPNRGFYLVLLRVTYGLPPPQPSLPPNVRTVHDGAVQPGAGSHIRGVRRSERGPAG
jgi:hypothetical protein